MWNPTQVFPKSGDRFTGLGHFGVGGSLALCDLESGLSVAITCNKVDVAPALSTKPTDSAGRPADPADPTDSTNCTNATRKVAPDSGPARRIMSAVFDVLGVEPFSLWHEDMQRGS